MCPRVQACAFAPPDAFRMMDASFSGRWPFQFPVPNSRVTLQPRRFAFGILIPTSEFLLWRACQCVQCFPFLLVVNAFVGMPEPRMTVPSVHP